MTRRSGQNGAVLGLLLAAVLLLLGSANVAASSYGEAVVVRTVVYPGQVVTAGVVRTTPLKRPVPPGMTIIQDVDDIVGKVAVRTLLPGQAIRAGSLRESALLEAGDLVPVTYRSGALAITITALALQDGYDGQPLQLRNPTTGQTFLGIMRADGTAVVATP